MKFNGFNALLALALAATVQAVDCVDAYEDCQQDPPPNYDCAAALHACEAGQSNGHG